MRENSQLAIQRRKSNEGLPRSELAQTPQRALHTRTSSQHFSVQKSILKNKEPETPAAYASSRSTHATPESNEPLRTDPGCENDFSDSEIVIRQIISERRAPQKPQPRKDSVNYLDSLQRNMEAIQTQDSQHARKLEMRRRHIKNLLLSTFISHSDNDYEEPITPRTGAYYSTSRPALTKPNIPTIVRPVANWDKGGLQRTYSIDKGEESKRAQYKPVRRSDEMAYRSSKY
mmetsp:Transcript_22695/g.40848  ORF Transcript_22695/g.40848 Transcript_22695/m.40848 type:complete len:231 (-) Transcript_22695:13-705(-)